MRNPELQPQAPELKRAILEPERTPRWVLLCSILSLPAILRGETLKPQTRG